MTLLPGKSYTLKIHFQKGVTWAGSNIYWDGTKLTFDAFGVKEREKYQGVFFKWGSMIGLAPITKQNAAPELYGYLPEYNPNNPHASTWRYYKLLHWNSVAPIYVSSHNTNRNDKYLFNLGDSKFLQDTTHYVFPEGDICHYLGVIGAAPAGYRMPTSAEFGGTDTDYHANWNATNPGPHLGGWMRIGADADFKEITTPPVDDDTRAGRFTGIPSGATYLGAYFPASGLRLYNEVNPGTYDGRYSAIGYWGAYWSGSIAFDSGAYHYSYAMRFHTVQINVKYTLYRNESQYNSALPIRCVKIGPNES
jgi:hypothetical protein